MIMINDHKMTGKIDVADTLLSQRKFDEAITLLKQIHRTDPHEESVLLRLAWASWDNGDKEHSIEYWEILLDRELQRKVFTGFAYDEMVRIYKQEGQVKKLVALCEKVTAIQPQDIGLLEELGKAYLLSAQNEKACDTFRKLTSMETDNPVFQCRLGEALLATGKTDEFESAYRQAGRLDPDETDRYIFQAADLCLRKGHYDTARRLVTECLKIAPSNSLYYCFLGDTLVALRQTENAFAAYAKACQCNRPHTAVYMNRLGNSLIKTEMFTDAVKALEAALAFDDSTPCRHHLDRARTAAGLPPLDAISR